MATVNKESSYSTNSFDAVIEVMTGHGVEDYRVVKLRFTPRARYLTPAELTRLGEYFLKEAAEIEAEYNEDGKLKTPRR